MNVNLWTDNNSQLREKLVTYNKPDIICVTETHLKGGNKIHVPEFTFIGMNRKTTGNKGSGGIGILIRNTMYNDYLIKKLLRVSRQCSWNIFGGHNQ